MRKTMINLWINIIRCLALFIGFFVYDPSIALGQDLILVGERSTASLLLIKGDASPIAMNWANKKNVVWSLPLKSARGVPRNERAAYRGLWAGKTNINDAKRVSYLGQDHIAVTGNSGNAIALINFNAKKVVYWSKTKGSGPHDVELLPSGIMAVANPTRRGSYVELYDIEQGNNKGYLTRISHPGVHAVHWDSRQNILWAWGQNARGLRTYRVVNGKIYLQRVYPMTVPNFEVGMAHGASPKIVGEKRYLLLSAKSGILQFDAETHVWNVIKRAPNDSGVYRGVKGLSYNDRTGEIIFTRSWNRVLSLSNKARTIPNARIYKARWWHENRL